MQENFKYQFAGENLIKITKETIKWIVQERLERKLQAEIIRLRGMQ